MKAGDLPSAGHYDGNPINLIPLSRKDSASLYDVIKAGTAKLDGDQTGFDQLRSILVPFTPDFEILPGPRRRDPPRRQSGSRCAI